MEGPAAPSAIEAEYASRLADRRRRVDALEKGHARYAAIRLGLAGLAIVALALNGVSRPSWLALLAAAFAASAVLHARLLTRRRTAEAAVRFYDAGLKRIRHAWMGTGRTGDTYRPTHHLYAADLDLFGRGSLFELLAVVRTKAGEETLARWLTTPATADQARARQGAVQELASQPDLAERIATIGDDVRTAVDAPVLRRWAAAPSRAVGPLARLALAALALVTSTLMIVWIATGTFGRWALAVACCQGVIAWALKSRVSWVIASVDEPAHDLEVLASLLGVLEREPFTSPALVALAARVRADAGASHEIAKLARLVEILSSRRNVIFAVPSAFLLWGTQWALAIEAWRARGGRRVPDWLDAIGELETLVALGRFAAEHPGHAFPEIVDGPPVIEADGLAHPTLGALAVGNDIAMARHGLRLVVVSGSNMSGKSTWLRTIGLSIVLAGAGAPVRARACRTSLPSIGASIRVEDSLVDGQSRFFAEITRLKAVVDLAQTRQGDAVFLLDEILSGTNSHDRRAGADGLIRSLIATGAIGLVTTHDLAIGEIVTTLEGSANAHFADTFDAGGLQFDFRLKPGPVATSNALPLMRSIGIDV